MGRRAFNNSGRRAFNNLGRPAFNNSGRRAFSNLGRRRSATRGAASSTTWDAARSTALGATRPSSPWAWTCSYRGAGRDRPLGQGRVTLLGALMSIFYFACVRGRRREGGTVIESSTPRRGLRRPEEKETRGGERAPREGQAVAGWQRRQQHRTGGDHPRGEGTVSGVWSSPGAAAPP